MIIVVSSQKQPTSNIVGGSVFGSLVALSLAVYNNLLQNLLNQFAVWGYLGRQGKMKKKSYIC
jgi:hypothetical protein